MRVSLFLLALSGLLNFAAALGSRGAAERAAYFITYLMEEIYGSDASKFTIATGCVGTRTGLGGQAKRCGLLEFCDYLWRDREDESGHPTGDTKPVLSNVKMSPKMNIIGNLDTNKIMNGIISASESVAVPGESNPKQVVLNKAAHGYVGATDTSKLNGVADWYQANEKIGDSMRDAITEIDKSSDNKFTRWVNNAKQASALVIDLRRSDSFQIALDQNNGYSKFAGGRPITSKPYTQLSGLVQGNVKQPDREGTITAWQSDITIGSKNFPALSAADATAMYDKAVTDADNSDGNRHKMAIAAAEESNKRITLSCG